MGVDYDAVGGVGIYVEDYLDKFISAGVFTEEEWEDDPYECVEKLGVGFSTYGNAYSGEEGYALLVDGNNLDEVNRNVEAFILKLKPYDIHLQYSDIKVISEGHVW